MKAFRIYFNRIFNELKPVVKHSDINNRRTFLNRFGLLIVDNDIFLFCAQAAKMFASKILFNIDRLNTS